MSKVFDKSTFFCKTKPISPNVQMNLTSAKTRDYINFRLCVRHKNKAKTKPISKMPKMNVNSIKTDDYGKNPAFCQNKNKANSNPNKANLPPAQGWGLIMGVIKIAEFLNNDHRFQYYYA